MFWDRCNCCGNLLTSHQPRTRYNTGVYPPPTNRSGRTGNPAVVNRVLSTQHPHSTLHTTDEVACDAPRHTPFLASMARARIGTKVQKRNVKATWYTVATSNAKETRHTRHRCKLNSTTQQAYSQERHVIEKPTLAHVNAPR